MDQDRKVVAEFSVKVDNFVERILKLEYVLGLVGVKPQVFQDLENKIADIKVQNCVTKNELKDDV